MRGQYDYEQAEQQRLKTVVIPAAYVKRSAAIRGSLAFNAADLEAKQAEALVRVSEGQALAIKDELDKIWGLCS